MRGALIALVISIARLADASSPGQDLDNARTYFRAKDCGSAMPLLANLVHPSEKLGDKSDLFEARAMLGACDVDTGHLQDAKTEFQAALQLKPSETLDSLFYSQPAIRVFEETKADIQAQAKRDAELRKLQEARDAYKNYLKSLVVYKQHSLGLNFVPFGAGQFQNGDTAKAIAFAATQGVTAGTSIGIWLYLVDKYGIRSSHVQQQDAQEVRNLQQIEIVSGGAFFFLYILSAIDAYAHYHPQTRVEGDESLLPPDPDHPKKPAKLKKTSILDHIVPMVTPSGVGIGLGWEN